MFKNNFFNKFLERPKSQLYVFYSKNVVNKRVIVYAKSYFEARNLMLESFNKDEYDLIEFRILTIDTEKFFEISHIEEEYASYPAIISESEYLRLERYIDNKQDSITHHTYALTKNTAQKYWEHDPSLNPPLYSINEFREGLEYRANENDTLRKEIISMMKWVGDIWYSETGCATLGFVTIYGKSRKQVIDKNGSQPRLLIEGTREATITVDDIERYKRMRNYMMENPNIRFPFIIDTTKTVL